MVDAALIAGALVAAYLAFAALALASDRPWHRIADGRPQPRKALPLLVGASFLLQSGSLALILLRDGPAFAALLWPAVLSVAGFLVAATVTWRPKLLTPAAAALSRSEQVP